MVAISWKQFILMVLGFYLFANFIFSVGYFLIGLNQLTGIMAEDSFHRFIEVSAFSAQTLTTVGYGRINPVGPWADILASFEALFGLMSFAFITGLLYGRFARPHAKLIYAENALIAPFQDKTALMLRIANGRSNQLVECEANILFNYLDKESNTRRFINLTLEYAKINALSLSWTIVHPIDENSPLNKLSNQELKESKAEIILMFKAFDDTYSQTVYTRFSYTAEEIIWGGKFVPMFKRNEDGSSTILELNKISLYDRVELP